MTETVFLGRGWWASKYVIAIFKSNSRARSAKVWKNVLRRSMAESNRSISAVLENPWGFGYSRYSTTRETLPNLPPVLWLLGNIADLWPNSRSDDCPVG